MKTLCMLASLAVIFASCTNANNGMNPPNSNSSYNNQNSNGYNSDSRVTSRVNDALNNDNDLSQYSQNVNVDTTNGVVTLTGSVPSKDVSNSIERKVKSVDGVRKVNNQLMIGG